jgi:hypothetical protein
MYAYWLYLDGRLATVLRSQLPLGSDNEVRGIATAKAERGELESNIPADSIRFCEVKRLLSLAPFFTSDARKE